MNRSLVGFVIGLIITFNVTILLALVYFNNKLDNTQVAVVELKQDIDDIQSYIYNTRMKLTLSPKEQKCLALNVYHEAGIEDQIGKLAVAEVTYNRLQTGHWGNNVCDVVYAPAQFSWTLDKKKKYSQPKGELWVKSQSAVKEFLKGKRVKGLNESKFYHADYIETPFWVDVNEKITQIGKHIFYNKARKAT